MPPLFAPLAIGKKDQPKNAVAAAALANSMTCIGAGPVLKTKAIALEFWNGLSEACSRNIAEIGGSGAKTALVPKGAAASKVPAAPATKSPHRKTAGAIA